MPGWSIEYEGESFARFYRSLREYEQRRPLDAILTTAGLDPWSLSGADRSVLIRVLCTFHGDRIVVLHHGYDKKRDPSPKRQQKEIAKARKIHEAWRRDRRR
jgi:phage-related protein